jgi:hypothetical protein
LRKAESLDRLDSTELYNGGSRQSSSLKSEDSGIPSNWVRFNSIPNGGSRQSSSFKSADSGIPSNWVRFNSIPNGGSRQSSISSSSNGNRDDLSSSQLAGRKRKQEDIGELKPKTGRKRTKIGQQEHTSELSKLETPFEAFANKPFPEHRVLPEGPRSGKAKNVFLQAMKGIMREHWGKILLLTTASVAFIAVVASVAE